MIYMQLFFGFLLVGLFSIGGGYAAIPLIQAQVVQAHAWPVSYTHLDVYKRQSFARRAARGGRLCRAAAF